MTDRPDDVSWPWIVKDCDCDGKTPCDLCDHAGWYFENTETGATVSDMMHDALDRHG